jgi:hypothetical protein
VNGHDEVFDDVLDRCRHGKTAIEHCDLCDAAQIDLREETDVDLTEENARLDE